ncbi:MAG: exodeoxyribonuclease V subunit beta [Bacteroidetes bacterium]|nr:MAG: exodeoxyribonuclease V subunit beta [Bacteroidota bacterium]
MATFDVKKEELNGSNLIEASAGTGKTYSLAILALRLIIEKNVPVEKILMVTFTNAAVAELESRIREFVRKAYKYAAGQPVNMDDDADIQQVVDNANAKTRKDTLKQAVQSLDKLSVMTIHSFCQQTIDEFTFETNQSFDYEVISDDSALLVNAKDKFVREVLNVMDYEQFLEVSGKIKLDKLPEMLRKYLQGMEYADTDEKVFEFEVRLKKERENYIKLKKAIEDNFEQIKKAKINGTTNLAKKRESAEEFLPVFVNECCKKPPGTHAVKLTFIYEPFGREYAESALDATLVYLHFFTKSAQIVQEKKSKMGLISYDDQIKTIHKALDKPQFREKLRQKYEAVFIDEFQDTDKYQYEIFNKVFSGKILFYIGDPKQSIYGWRGADLDTYKAAKDSVGERVLKLGKNFRSTPRMLAAMEKLMNPGGGYNMFLDDKILFETVKPGKPDKEEMKIEGRVVPPVTIWEFDADDENTSNAAVAQEIFNLLNVDVNFEKDRKKILPGDIGVLVRTKAEGVAIKQELAKYNINSLQRDDTKVLASDEASQIRYLIHAVLNPRLGAINRALYYKWYGFSFDTFNELDEKEHIDVFASLRDILFKEGIFNMVARFLDVYGIRAKCMEDLQGQRVLTNINQITEVLHRIEKKGKLPPDELLVWMQRNRDNDNEEYQQRIESDDDAVQISTIHKAKGLQYNIVFAPGLCMIPKFKFIERNKINSFKKNGVYYFTLNYPDLTESDRTLFDLEKEQENRRLIYVALTRAKYKCYISFIPKTYKNNTRESSFDYLFNQVKGGPTDLIEVKNFSGGKFKAEHGKYTPAEEGRKICVSGKLNITYEDIKPTFGIHSFSGLNSLSHSTPFEAIEIDGSYDNFIFQQLPRGATPGNALHNIFERLHFDKPDTWPKTLEDAAGIYTQLLTQEYMPYFRTLVEHTMNVEIQTHGDSLQLRNISHNKVLPELEFVFSVKNTVKKTDIDDILGEEADLSGPASMQGLMTGFVDLLFQHNNKYYILDWKSNYLGSTPEDYSPQALREAMKASNYTLQYTIYTIAVKRWLESRLPDFDYDRDFGGVIYLYLRGIRQGKDTGIYFNKPKAEKIRALDAMLSGG